MTNENSEEHISNNLPVSSAEEVLDKKALFSKLFKVQHPMTQEVPLEKREEPDY